MNPSFQPLWAAPLLVAALVGCKPAPLPGEPNAGEGRTVIREAEQNDREAIVLASVNGRSLTLEEYERRMAQRGPESQEYFASEELRPQFLERLLWYEVMANEALRNGWNDAPEAAVLEPDYVTQAVLERTTPPEAGEVSEDDIADAWATQRDEVIAVERRRVWIAQFATREEADLAESRVRSRIAEELDSPLELMRYEARVHSTHEATRALGGELGWVVRRRDGGNVIEALEEAVFAAEQNSVAGVVDVEGGALLVYVGAVLEVSVPTDEEAAPWVRQQLSARQVADAQRAQLDGWREAATVEIDADVVAALSAQRQDRPDDQPIRPRRYDVLALAGGPERTFGHAWNSLAAAADADYRQTPFATDFVAPAAEGSGDTTAPDLETDL